MGEERVYEDGDGNVGGGDKYRDGDGKGAGKLVGENGVERVEGGGIVVVKRANVGFCDTEGIGMVEELRK